MGESVGDVPPEPVDALVSRLREPPVRLALLFGSHATDDATPTSDLDIAVAYETDTTDVTDRHLSLVADLTRIVGSDDVDVVRLESVDPRIAVEALEDGRLLVGSHDVATALRNELEPARRERERAVRARVSEAERAIEQRIERRENGSRSRSTSI